jgi:penicillin-binding protein 1A
LFWLAAGGVVVGGAAAWAMFGYFSQDLPSIDALKNYSPKIVTFFYSDDGRVIGEYSTERRIVVPLAKIPDHVRKAFIAAEDSNFYHHQGVDPQSIIRAFLANLEAGTTVQGGSTITQQVTRSFLLSPEKTYTRKIREAILAYRIDKYLSKDEILYLYLNHIYLGHGAYGVESAAQVYFDKHVDQLSIAEAAQLAGMPQAPSRWSPFNNPEAAERRRLYAVSRMLENGFITREQAEKADREKPTFRDRSNVNLYAAPYFAEHIRRLMVDQYGEDQVHNDGFQVYTTVNIEYDQRAHEAVARGVREFTRRRPYEGPHKQLAPEEVGAFLQRQTAEFAENPIGPGSEFEAVVTELNAKDGQIAFKAGAISGVIRKAQSQWAVKNQALNKLFKPGSVILVRAEEVKIQPKKEEPKKDGDKKKPEAKPAPEPKPEEVRTEIQYQLEAKPEVQSALMSLDLRDGAVKAMVGGRDFKESQFNRAIQSRRQPGSAFKPIIYTAAMDNGFTPGSVLIDSPIVHDDFAHGRRWKPTNYDHKFYGPTDLYTGLTQSRNVLAIKLLSKVGYPAVFDTAKKLGLTGDMPMNLSLALGSHGVSLSELVSAFSTYPNLGERVDPWFITRVVDRNGNVIQEGHPNRQRVISSGTACTILYMLKGVVEHGTGTRVKALGRPCGGKTGTTNDLSDAWFVGFTAEYVTGVWIGLDEMKRMGWGESGGQAAAPIFLYYMQDVLKGRPIQDFVPPPDAQIVTNGSSSICYKAGTVGTGISELGGGGSGDEFLKSDLEEKDM